MKLTKKVLTSLLEEVLLEVSTGETSQGGDDKSKGSTTKETDIQTKIDNQIDAIDAQDVVVKDASDAYYVNKKLKQI